MIRPDWNIFKTKFSGNPQAHFEWFCYLLFCKEFGKDKGIFRFKNQSAIETEPIEDENEVIGWQAKFFDTSLSSHKNEILNTIEKVTRDYSNVTKIIFYTNQEWGQNKGQQPRGLTEIEKKAKELNIKLEWRTRSFFESPFVCIDNEVIAKHFFTFDKSIFDLIKKLENHTENVLKQIKTTFNFKGKVFDIDRSEVVDKLEKASEQVIILSGAAGVGKTVVIKKYYENQKGKFPFYVFKAIEFDNLRNINEILDNFDFIEFINAHKDDEKKVIVIDSAEKILNITNTDPFKEFLKIIIENRWKVIFTTRDNYVDILNTEFSEIYGIIPLNINIQNLPEEELVKLSNEYNFDLPDDHKLYELIRNPLYLNEYLNYYTDARGLDYKGFKDKLWNSIVTQSKPNREQCFLQIAYERASSGRFYINPACESLVLTELSNSGILGYESPYGYFITHDIYEEWALERIIEREFISKTSIEEFFSRIGDYLPIRRSFRSWLSEKLLLKQEDIKQFIENAVTSDIAQHWKDEIFISILLSDYSETFFDIFKEELKGNSELLKRLTFLLRLACKEVDNDLLNQLGLKNINLFSLKYVVTKPKGKGWESIIKFIFDNMDSIGIKNINFILPVLYEWNSKFRTGDTTRYASLIALEYYQWVSEQNVFISNYNYKDKFLRTILFGASEIKGKLEEIFEKILENNWKYHGAPYYDLVKIILVPNFQNDFAGLEVAKVLPEYVLKLADLFWSSYTSKKDDPFYSYRKGLEQYFGLEEMYRDYFPASAYQTPIYWLLQFYPKETIDFILKFTNKTVEYYAKSNLDKNQVKEVDVFIEEDTTIKQYISNRLWYTYRGTGISPEVLESMHMALEKYLLEQEKYIGSKTLESRLLYLLRNSKSASISAVITSIVLAYCEKTFNIAKILFKTREFFFYDTRRRVLDQIARIIYSIGYGFNYHHKFYQDERIKTCDDKHRRWSLEELFLSYQLFVSKEISKEEAERRQKELWGILDNYYRQLPDKSKETEEDKRWRLSLARMDRRKTKITIEDRGEDISIQCNPEIEPELKKFSEESIAKTSEFMKFPPLKLWATYKIKNDEKYKEYKHYEKNPKQALKEVKEIIQKIDRKKSYEFYFLNHSIPAEVCSVLIKFYINELTEEEKEFCKKIILDYASLSLEPDYQYQISDGVESAISVLPILFKEFPEERKKIKRILLLTLFDTYLIGMYAEFADFPTRAIKDLFEISFEDAQSLLFGYLKLKPRYEELREKMRQKCYKEGIYEIKESDLVKEFEKDSQTELQKVLGNSLTYNDLEEIEKLDLYILSRAFQLIPEKTDNEVHKKLAMRIINAFVPKILLDDREERIDYKVKHDFLQNYVYYVLNLPEDEIKDYLKPFIDNFNTSKVFADLFEEFIYAEDILNTYDKFWLIWECFQEKIFEICKNRERCRDIDNIIKGYLFATVNWKKDAKEWHTLKSNNKKFFKEVSEKIGHCPSTLDALAKLLNGVGNSYIDDAVSWISGIIEINKCFIKHNFEENTIYYIENLCTRYIYNNPEKIRKDKVLRDKILVILNFLIEKSSVVGYMLREGIS